MPVQKDFKRLVRARMQKTGESYTSARARLLQQRSRQGNATKPAATKALAAATLKAPPASRIRAADYARLAGMTDAVIKAKTGCTWKAWVDALDYHGARDLSHGEIAKLVRTKFEVGAWWTQAVTVGYERILGLREIGQRRDGGYEASKSKTVAAPIGALYRAFAVERQRRRWLTGVKVTIRTAARDKSMRWGMADGTLVMLYFASKGKAKSQVAVQHTKLRDREARERAKAYWGEKLETLAELFRA